MDPRRQDLLVLLVFALTILTAVGATVFLILSPCSVAAGTCG